MKEFDDDDDDYPCFYIIFFGVCLILKLGLCLEGRDHYLERERKVKDSVLWEVVENFWVGKWGSLNN